MTTAGNGPSVGVTRRRAITLVAAAAGLGLSGLALTGLGGRRAGAETLRLHRWQGVALGARANLAILHPDEIEARRLIALARAEIARLEKVFSLYRAESALARLNRDGRLPEPPLEMVALLDRARRWSVLTDGAFDVTVQPLWSLYQAHFAEAGADPRGPGPAALDAARRLVDYRGLEVSTRRIAFARPGMAVTLNGIAQGYVTDRVADLLRREGLERVLIDLGEIRALGAGPAGGPWRVGLADPSEPGRIRETLEVVDRAVATSAATGTVFGGEGRHHHIFDPASGRSAQGLLAATAVAARATDADACSTALVAGGRPVAGRSYAELGIERIITHDQPSSPGSDAT
jgi:thiamine biosynthesis lipoprotein